MLNLTFLEFINKMKNIQIVGSNKIALYEKKLSHLQLKTVDITADKKARSISKKYYKQKDTKIRSNESTKYLVTRNIGTLRIVSKVV